MAITDSQNSPKIIVDKDNGLMCASVGHAGTRPTKANIKHPFLQHTPPHIACSCEAKTIFVTTPDHHNSGVQEGADNGSHEAKSKELMPRRKASLHKHLDRNLL
jgi:hypothetical protein